MALAFSSTLRSARADQINTAINGGSGPGLLRIYSGSRPATGGVATTLLAELTFSDPAFNAAVSGVLTAAPIFEDSSANAAGTATWFRIVDSSGTFVMDGNCGVTGSDLNLNSVNISVGQSISVTSFVITEGNP
jgi:hypothetical protein